MTAAALAASLLAILPVPQLTGPVVDEAGLVSPPERDRLEALARSARAQQGGEGVQLQILTVPSLDGEPIEDFSIRVAEAWKIGTKGKDNGLLLVVSRADRRYRLEVGGGLEGELTDSQARHLLDQTLQPAFRAGQFGQGLEAASVAALRAVGGLPVGVAAPAPALARPSPVHTVGLLAILFFLLSHGGFFLLLFIVILFLRSRGGYWGGGYGGGGWSSGGGGGGGGWSGGGGGFSGGGASGGW